MAATDLYTCAKELLDACSEALALSPGGPIARAYVSPGAPAFDCEQLTVHSGGPQVAETSPAAPILAPGHRIVYASLVDLITLTATVVRCVSTFTEQGGTVVWPNPADLDADAQVTLGDCWAIWNHVVTRKRNGTLWPPDTRELFMDPAVSVITSGGFAAWQLQFRVQLGGYRTVPDGT